MAESKGYAPRLKKPATLDHLKKKEPIEKSVPILLSDASSEALDAARDRVFRAESDQAQEEQAASPKRRAELQDAVTAAKAALADAFAAQDEETVWMRFRSIGRKGYDKLVDKNPPTDEQKAEAEKSGNMAIYDPKAFGPAIVAASCIEPQMTLDDATDLYETWNGSEWMTLFMAAMEVNTGRRVVDLGNASGGTQT